MSFSAYVMFKDLGSGGLYKALTDGRFYKTGDCLPGYCMETLITLKNEAGLCFQLTEDESSKFKKVLAFDSLERHARFRLYGAEYEVTQVLGKLHDLDEDRLVYATSPIGNTVALSRDTFDGLLWEGHILESEWGGV